ncbi:MAG: enoyl-CoA hydratase/isomerase family protein [Acidobacteria bacterium]|nr:enoyl-CoA hydratase/isomerase family protein [Acidobacteriota bacterium]
MNLEDITFEVNDEVGVLTFNRPDVMNAFRRQTQREIEEVLAAAADDPGVRCLVMTGAGRAFSAGADLKDLAAGRGGETWTERGAGDAGAPRPGPRTARAAANMFATGRSVLAFPKPTIAAINGYCVGGGMMFALPADIRIASDQAKFAVSFTKRGLTPETGLSYFLPRIIGMEQAMLLTYTGDTIDAEEAARIGLVSRVVPHDELMTATLELAGRIAAGPTVQLSFAKMQMQLGMLANNLEVNFAMEAWGLQSSGGTEDYLEGHRAFYEKRDPRFTGR